MSLALRLVRRLADFDRRLVLAESCTGGRVAGELSKVPGVSNWFCGSAVTYRNDSKIRWLGVSADTIRAETAVSATVARQMARGILERTPEASFAASITGHLGPDAPREWDGVVFIGLASRASAGAIEESASRHQLATADRVPRQSEATELVLATVLQFLGDSNTLGDPIKGGPNPGGRDEGPAEIGS